VRGVSASHSRHGHPCPKNCLRQATTPWRIIRRESRHLINGSDSSAVHSNQCTGRIHTADKSRRNLRISSFRRPCNLMKCRCQRHNRQHLIRTLLKGKSAGQLGQMPCLLARARYSGRPLLLLGCSKAILQCHRIVSSHIPPVAERPRANCARAFANENHIEAQRLLISRRVL
jgi:hypothetical protein